LIAEVLLMRRLPDMSFVALVLICLLLLPDFGPILRAQASAPTPAQKSPPPPTAQELDQLMSSIALYPDALLAQITTASTNPQEILDVTNWLAKNPGLTGPELTAAAEKQGYDPAFLALVTFPKVLQMMADHIDDYAAIGLAVTANQADVSASIQRLRAQAYAAGNLRSNEQQKVEVQQVSSQPVYVIQPANPVVVYVPVYNPTAVYVAAPSPAVLITFGVGIGISALVYSNQPWGWAGWGWGWGRGGVIYYNRGPWGGVWVGGYRPPVYWYHPRPPYYAGYPGYGGNWGYHPPHYRPPYPTNPPIYRPPGYRPPVNGSPGYRPPASTRPLPPNAGNRPPTAGNLPSTRPVQPGMGTRPPGGGNQPSTRPVRPSNPNGGGPPSGTRPAPQPGGQARPAPKPATQPRAAPRSAN
jgi:hypothetical protein